MTHAVHGYAFLCLLLVACTGPEGTVEQPSSPEAKTVKQAPRLITKRPAKRDVSPPRGSSMNTVPEPSRSATRLPPSPSKLDTQARRVVPTKPNTAKSACPVCRDDFSVVFTKVSPSVVGVAAGRMLEGRFTVAKRGTGFAWNRQGHIVTNAHTVAEANEVRVRTKDGKVVRAQVVGLDASTDLAVLSVEGVQLLPVERGEYERVVPGQWVAAIGNPYGMEHSITVGVVSAIGRKNLPPGAPRYADFIQSDVSIFPGNSGGPLVNAQSQVIGLNTAKLGQGLSFSTRIDMVATVVERLVREGRFDRGFAGLIVRRVSTRVAEASGLSGQVGARVRAVVQDGPAAMAGIEPGDIILEYDGQKISGPASLPWMIAATRPGSTVSVRIARDRDRLLVDLEVSPVP